MQIPNDLVCLKGIIKLSEPFLLNHAKRSNEENALMAGSFLWINELEMKISRVLYGEFNTSYGNSSVQSNNNRFE